MELINLKITTRTLQRGLIAVLTMFLVAGCGPAPETRPDPATYSDSRARTLLAEGDLPGAAKEFLRIADLAPASEQTAFRFAAADALLEAGDVKRARAALNHPTLVESKGPVAQQRVIFLSRSAGVEGNPAAGLQLLRGITPTSATPDIAIQSGQLRADLLAQSGNPGAAAAERSGLELLLTDPDEISANRQRLWALLNELPVEGLEPLRRPPPDTFGGWVELALLEKRYSSNAVDLSNAIVSWSSQYPGHPANASVLPAIVADAQAITTPATHVALLLPLGGQFGDAAEAIRDGFMASWYASPPDQRPTVSIFDTDAGQDIAAVHANAVSQGADFVVGPLLKDTVRTLSSAPLPVRTLALNSIETEPHDPTKGINLLYQFALSPEGEAEEVAKRAYADGHRQSVVLVPDSEWGQRVSQAFHDEWATQGGAVVQSLSYGTDANALADTVRTMLQIDKSEARAKSLMRTLGRRVKFEPRRRKDMDAIFLAAFPREARQLRPQIDFYRATEVPVYATSHIFSGQSNPNSDGDINGIVFGDMPWVLRGADELTRGDMRSRVQGLWPGAAGGFTRFYAFGADAYQLVLDLGRLQSQPDAVLQGHTGGLSLDETQQVKRSLDWAIFDDGIPRRLAAPSI